MSIGAEIRRLRKERGLTQTQLAEGVTAASYVSLIERGLTTPSKKIIRGLAEKLQKPVGYFNSYEDDITVLQIREKIDRLRALSATDLSEANRLALELQNENISSWEPELRGHLYLALGYYSWANKELDYSISYYQQARNQFLQLGYDNEVIRSLHSLGTLHLRQNNLKVAIDCLKEALTMKTIDAIEPKLTFRIQCDLASCLFRQGNHREAHQIYTKLYKGNIPSYEERINILLCLSTSYQANGNPKMSYELSTQARKLAVEHEDTLNGALALRMAANSLAELREWDKAEEFLLRAGTEFAHTGQKEEQISTKLRRASLAIAKGNIEECEAILSGIKVPAKTPLEAKYNTVLSEIALAKDQWSSALEHLMIAADIYLTTGRYEAASQALKEAGEILHKRGDVSKAADLFLKALNTYQLARKEMACSEDLD